MVIFQDFSLFPNLSVAENIAFATTLSRQERLYKARHSHEIAQAALDRIGVSIDLDARVETLPVAQKQLVAICRALASQAQLIIMDEPTTALTEKEVKRLPRHHSDAEGGRRRGDFRESQACRGA